MPSSHHRHGPESAYTASAIGLGKKHSIARNCCKVPCGGSPKASVYLRQPVKIALTTTHLPLHAGSSRIQFPCRPFLCSGSPHIIQTVSASNHSRCPQILIPGCACEFTEASGSFRKSGIFPAAISLGFSIGDSASKSVFTSCGFSCSPTLGTSQYGDLHFPHRNGFSFREHHSRPQRKHRRIFITQIGYTFCAHFSWPFFVRTFNAHI